MPTELSPEELDAIRARHEAAPRFEIPAKETRSDDIEALLSHADALAAKVARLEGELDDCGKELIRASMGE